MPRTTQCPKCGVVLNLPEKPTGKKLKCPRCGERFLDAAGDGGARPDSTSSGTRPASPASSLELTARQSEPDLPTVSGDLRDTFDPIMMLGEATPEAASRRPAEASAADLFKEPKRPRGPATLGDARAKARRCPTCSSVVPAGMSLCARCGLDLDTGQRHHLDDLLDDTPPPPRPVGVPLAVSIIGLLTMIVSLILLVLAIIESQKPDATGWVMLSLGLVGALGIYGSAQFLRGKSMKPLITALLLGGVVNILTLIMVPILDANTQQPIEFGQSGYYLDENDMPAILSFEERLKDQMWKINWGIAILLIDIALIIFLLNGGAGKHFEASRPVSKYPLV